jgi:hypothetical protein
LQITVGRKEIAQEIEMLYSRAKFKTLLMKRIILGVCLVGAFSVLSNTASAQYRKGDNLLNIGIGLNTYYEGGVPLSAIYEAGVSDDISFGGGIDYLSYHYATGGIDYSYTATYIGVRGSYHFNKLLNLRNENWDIYGGLSLGYRSFSWKNYKGAGASDAYGSGLYLGLHAGARYYFSKSVGGFFELGALGSTNARLGVAFKF